jgi:kynurenine formamidase
MTTDVASFTEEEQEILGWFKSLSNWGRWGADDEKGTLNLITDEVRIKGARAVRHGVPVACAWELTPGVQPADFSPFPRMQRYMIHSGQGQKDAHKVHKYDTPFDGCLEYVGIVFHGWNVTHLDSLCHCFWDGMMYNGRPAELVTELEGATCHAVTAAQDGITTRGVLLDVAAARGVKWLEPGEGVRPEDLIAAEERQGVKVESGDALLVRTGYGRRKREIPTDPTKDGPMSCCGATQGAPGPHVSLTPWLHERGVSLFASDTGNELYPSGLTPYLDHSFHAVSQVAMGMWLLDNCDLEALGAKCAELNQYDFLFSAPPLMITGGTGSPVTPVALL